MIVLIGGNSLVAKMTNQIMLLSLNLFFEIEYAAIVAMINVATVAPKEMITLFFRYL
jgi:hypothetical protein